MFKDTLKSLNVIKIPEEVVEEFIWGYRIQGGRKVKVFYRPAFCLMPVSRRRIPFIRSYQYKNTLSEQL